MIKRYSNKYRIFPNEEQKKVIEKNFGCTRYIYNRFLALEKENYEKWKEDPNSVEKKFLTYMDLTKLLPKLKEELIDEDGSHWLKEADASALVYTCKHLDNAFRNFFKGNKSGVGYPKFKSKYNRNKSYRTQGVRIKDGKLILPKIKDPIDIDIHRSIDGRIIAGTISCDPCNEYYVSISLEKEIPEPSSYNNASVGIDMGVVHFATTSDGQFIDMPDISKLEKRKKRLQKDLSRKVKGSKNWEKNRLQIAKIDKRIVNIRKDFQHKLSRELVDNYGTIVVENLNIKNMTKSAKGTIENPGKNVKAKSGLNRSILQQGWNQFTSMLEYKEEWNGGELVKVDPKYTSQTCSNCGCVDSNNRKNQSTFICVECGYEENADVNAAKNILGRSIKL